MLELSKREARRLMIGAQLLAGPPPKRATKQRMLDTIRHLGAVQIDSISVVARTHHIVLWSRIGDHPHDWIYDLLLERQIFEYWVHAAAYAPIELYPCFRRKMLEYADPHGNGFSEWSRAWMRENVELFERVAAHVREHGPVSSKSFDPPEGTERAAAWAWYGNKPTNRVLEYLWTMGALMVDRREKFSRWYDLAERVHPAWDDMQLPTVEEERATLSAVTLRALGVLCTRWLPDYFRTSWGVRDAPASTSRVILDELVERGLAVSARVEGLADSFVVATELLDRRIPPSRTTLLSPFDNLIWHRARTADLFDFELRLEAYTPADKRQFGYFSLPILYRDRLVGRLDPKADRKARVLHVRALHLEPWFVGQDDDRFYLALSQTTRDFARFNRCDTVVVERGDPPYCAERLAEVLDAI